MALADETDTDEDAVDASTAALDPQAPERVADRMLAALRLSSLLAVFDWNDDGAGAAATADTRLDTQKAAADLLVRGKLARFTDDTATEIEISKAGRYWAAHGGYLTYLKEEPAAPAGGGGRQRNPEMEALRSEYMKLRLNTFWYSFGLSIAASSCRSSRLRSHCSSATACCAESRASARSVPRVTHLRPMQREASGEPTQSL